MNNRPRLFAIVLLLITFGAGFSRAGILNVPQNYQEQNEWCWAASSQSVLAYFGVNLTQTQIAQYGTGGQNIPNYVAASSATENGVNAILNHFDGIASTGYGGALAQDALARDFDLHGAPVVILWNWDGGGGHILVVHGLVNGTAYLMDPWNGPTIASYDWVVRGGTHTWYVSLELNSSPPERNLTIDSSNPGAGVQVTATPSDNGGQTSAVTPSRCFLNTAFRSALLLGKYW